MAESGGSSDVKDEEKTSSNLSEDNMKFKDPLTSALDRDSDDGEMESLDLDASLRTETTVSRSSSLIANLSHYGDDVDTETNDLFVVVDNPEKHSGTMESYITFRITTKTTRTEFDSSDYAVRRRYNDFVWLRNSLEEAHSTHLVPPLPEKHSLKRLDRFSADFLRVRQGALQKFMTRLADHPVLSFDKNFQVFLTAKAWEFQSYKKQGSGILSRVTDSIHNIGASYMMKNRPPEFTVMQEYVQLFGEKLGILDRVAQRILREQAEYLGELNSWGPIYILWSNSEDQLNSALLAMSKAVDNTCAEVKALMESTDDQFSQPVREYMLYSEAIKAVLRRRDAIQMEYDLTVEELNKKKDEREHVKISDQSYSLGAFLGKDPEDVKQQKQEKLEQTIEELTQQMEALNDKVVCADSDLRADMERWHRGKHKDLKELFLSMSDRYIQYYEKCLSGWETAIRTIQARELPTDVPTSTTTNNNANVIIDNPAPLTNNSETDQQSHSDSGDNKRPDTEGDTCSTE
ncbi:hypothetical protein ScPMuIL_005641 [Solemya velum]